MRRPQPTVVADAAAVAASQAKSAAWRLEIDLNPSVVVSDMIESVNCDSLEFDFGFGTPLLYSIGVRVPLKSSGPDNSSCS